MFLGSAQVSCRDRLGMFFSRGRLFLHRIGSLPLLVTAVMKLLVGGLLLHSYSLTQIAWPGHIRRVSFCHAIGRNAWRGERTMFREVSPIMTDTPAPPAEAVFLKLVPRNKVPRSRVHEKWFNPISKTSLA
jgi:hypothetical protein